MFKHELIRSLAVVALATVATPSMAADATNPDSPQTAVQTQQRERTQVRDQKRERKQIHQQNRNSWQYRTPGGAAAPRSGQRRGGGPR